MRGHSVTAPGSGLLLRATGALVLGCVLTIVGVLQGGSPNAQADGNAWQNANGTSTTATGQATIAGGQLAMVFAFATDNPVSGCSSPAGSCSIAAPDGPNSFEVFANAGTPTVSFSVTTTAPSHVRSRCRSR